MAPSKTAYFDLCSSVVQKVRPAKYDLIDLLTPHMWVTIMTEGMSGEDLNQDEDDGRRQVAVKPISGFSKLADWWSGRNVTKTKKLEAGDGWCSLFFKDFLGFPSTKGDGKKGGRRGRRTTGKVRFSWWTWTKKMAKKTLNLEQKEELDFQKYTPRGIIKGVYSEWVEEGEE